MIQQRSQARLLEGLYINQAHSKGSESAAAPLNKPDINPKSALTRVRSPGARSRDHWD